MDSQEKTDVKLLERLIGYRFVHPGLAIKALKSANALFAKTSENHLALLGRSALSFALNKALSLSFGEISLGGDYLFDLSSAGINGITENYLSDEGLSVRTLTLGINRLAFLESDASSKELADTLRAVVGAVTVDSEWNADALDTVANNLLNLNFRLFHYPKDAFSYKDKLATAVMERFRDVPDYEVTRRERESDYACIARIPSQDLEFLAFGDNPYVLEEEAAEIACLSIL